jgi:hypothetical protein
MEGLSFLYVFTSLTIQEWILFGWWGDSIVITQFDLMESGQTIARFQIESPGMRATLREIHVRTTDDIMAYLTLVCQSHFSLPQLPCQQFQLDCKRYHLFLVFLSQLAGSRRKRKPYTITRIFTIYAPCAKRQCKSTPFGALLRYRVILKLFYVNSTKWGKNA